MSIDLTAEARRIVELGEKATAGPWETQPIDELGDERGACFIVGTNLGGLVGAALPFPTEIDSGDFSRVRANAAFFTTARNHAPAIAKAYIALAEATSLFLEAVDTGLEDPELDTFIRDARRLLAPPPTGTGEGNG